MGAFNIFGALAGGFAKGVEQKRRREFEENMAKRQQTLGTLAQLAGQPNLSPDAQEWIWGKIIETSQQDIHKPIKPIDITEMAKQQASKSPQPTAMAPPQGNSGLVGVKPLMAAGAVGGAGESLGMPRGTAIAPPPLPPGTPANAIDVREPSGRIPLFRSAEEMQAEHAAGVRANAEANYSVQAKYFPRQAHLQSKQVKGPNGPMWANFNPATGEYTDPDTGAPIENAEPISLTQARPIRGWQRDAQGRPYSVLLNPMNNQPIEGSENYDVLPPVGYADRISSREILVPQADGSIKLVPTSSVSRAVIPPKAGGGVAAPPPPPGTTPTKGTVTAPKRGATTKPTRPAAPATGTPQTPGRVVGGKSQVTKPTAQEQNRRAQAGIITEQIRELDSLIDAASDYMGPVAGRLSKIARATGTAPDEVNELYTALESFSSLMPILHGYRGGQEIHKQFTKAIGGLEQNPDALRASLRAIETLAESIKKGTAEAVGGTTGTPPPPPGGQLTPEQEVEAYKRKRLGR